MGAPEVLRSAGNRTKPLGAAAAMVVGAGSLGLHAGAQLAVAGVGRLSIADGAEVGAGAGAAVMPRPDERARRAEVAASWAAVLAPAVQADPYPARLDDTNAPAMIDGHDVVLDLSDDGATRAATARACESLGLPLVAGARTPAGGGWVAALKPPATACMGCTERALSGSAASGTGAHSRHGAAGAASEALAGQVGAAAAAAAIDLLCGEKTALGRVLVFDGPLSARAEGLSAVFDCPVCGTAAGRGG
jgi:molybdopterin/thiamine biosynthesis adenylyltransferase